MTRPRHHRTAIAQEERGRIVRTKVITSDALGESGKLGPKQGLPGGSGILPERERGKPNISKLLEKVNDLESYNPQELSDAVLRDDFRIVLAWYATLKEDGEFRYDEATIHSLLKGILEEAKRRGPKVIRFDPEHMKPSVKAFFLKVAREVGVPSEQFKGQVAEKQIRANDLDLFFYLRLPPGVRMALSEFSKEVAKENETDVEDVDHITLLYLKKPEGRYSDGEAAKALEVAREVFAGTGPLELTLEGWAYFDQATQGGKPKTALVVLVDSEELAPLYVKLKEELGEEGIEVEQKHGFIPHATIAYLDPGTRLKDLPLLGTTFQVTAAELAHSGIRQVSLKGGAFHEGTTGKVPNSLVGMKLKKSFYYKAIEAARKGGTVLELFAGTGRSECAEIKGARHVAVEKDAARCKAYQKRWPKAEVHTGDNVEFLEAIESLADVTVADFDASGSPFDAVEKFLEVAKLDKPVLGLATWGYTYAAFNQPGRWDRAGAWQHMKQKMNRLSAKHGKEAKALGWSWPDFGPQVIYGAFSMVHKGGSHLGSPFPDVDESFALSKLEKRINLNPGSDVERFTGNQLLEAHWLLHQLYRNKGPKAMSERFSTEDLTNFHALLVDELLSRGTKHPPPPDDGLDEVSSDFEQGKGQPDYWTPPFRRRMRKEEVEFAKVHSSGVERGREISLEEVLPHFKSFKVRKPYVYLVGGLAANGKTKGDIDILIKDSEFIPDDLKHILKFRLGRALPPELNNRVEFHFDSFKGPFTNFVELFDMTLERINPSNEIKHMSEESLEMGDRDAIYLRAAEETEDVDATEGS